MFKHLCLVAVLVFPSGLRAQKIDTTNCLISSPPTMTADDKEKDKKQDNKMFLGRVVCEVEKALDAYQQSEDVTEKKLVPPLASADFDFKTVVDTKGGFSISFLIFKFGATVDKQDTNDVDFQYVPKSLLGTAFEGSRAKSLQTELIDTIESAAKAIVEQSQSPAPGADPLTFKQLSVTVSYGITWDVSGGLNAPISLVTLGPSIDHSKNNVQSVKLVFAPPPKKPTKKPASQSTAPKKTP